MQMASEQVAEQRLTMEDIRGEVNRCVSEYFQREIGQLTEKLQYDLQKVLGEGLEHIRQQMSTMHSVRTERVRVSNSFASSCGSDDANEFFDHVPRTSLAESSDKDHTSKKCNGGHRNSRVRRRSQSSQESSSLQTGYVEMLKLLGESRRARKGRQETFAPPSRGQPADDEVLQVVPRLLKPPTAARFVFWTGGFDSTFRVLQALFAERRPVVPVYLTGAIDNFSRCSFRRRSGSFELVAMQTITSVLKQTYPEAEELLQDVVTVPEVAFEGKCALSMRKLHAENIVRRRRCQYGAMAQFSLDIGIPIDVSVVEGDFLYKNLQDRMEQVDGDWQVSSTAMETLPELAIFRLLRFPLMRYSKEAILDEARQRGYEAIMQMTWSCWFPKKAGQPCQKCAMCKHRIL